MDNRKSTVNTDLTEERAYWTRRSVERRKQHLIKADCNPRWIDSLTNEHLVDSCLVVDGVLAGELTKLPQESSKISVAAALATNQTTSAFMMMFKQMEQDRRQERQQADESRRQERQEAAIREDRLIHEADTRQKLLTEQIERMLKQTQTTRHVVQSNVGEGLIDVTFNKFDGLLRREVDAWPTESYDVPIHLASIDRAFRENNVPDEFHVRLLRQHLPQSARRILSSLPDEAVQSYADLKKRLCEHYALTSAKYKELYYTATMRSDENFVQYQARLARLLEYYVNSRNVNSLPLLKELIIADKIKNSMSKNIIEKVNDREMTEFMPVNDLCIFADKCKQMAHDEDREYVKFNTSNKRTVKCFSCGMIGHVSSDSRCPNRTKTTGDARNEFPIYKTDNINRFTATTDTARSNKLETHNRSSFTPRSINGATGDNRFGNKTANGASKNNWNNYDRNKSTFATQRRSHSADRATDNKTNTRNAKYCTICRKDNHNTDKCYYNKSVNRIAVVSNDDSEYDACVCDLRERHNNNKIIHNVGCHSTRVYDYSECYDDIDVERLCELTKQHIKSENSVCAVRLNSADNSHDTFVNKNTYTIPQGSVKIKIGDKVVNAIVDSGAEISVFKKIDIDDNLLTSNNCEFMRLRSAFGETIDAEIFQLECKSLRENGTLSGSYTTNTAVLDKVQHSLLTPTDYLSIVNSDDNNSFIPDAALLNGSNILANDEFKGLTKDSDSITVSSLLELYIINREDTHKTVVMPSNVLNTEVYDVDVVTRNKHKESKTPNDSLTNTDNTDKQNEHVKLNADEAAIAAHDNLVELQTTNSTLQQYWPMAKSGRSEFFVRDKLLYKKTVVVWISSSSACTTIV